MIVIIAEKPSLARNIVAGIDSASTGVKMQKRNGYFEGSGYIVTWAFGHLFSLCDIEDYTGGEVGKWTLDNLPCFPETFRFKLKTGPNKKVDEGVARQFDIINHLCCRNDVDTIVNAGDSDREGEIIIRLCVANSDIFKQNEQKKLLRLWLPDQTPQTVRSALAEMKDESEYDNLANEGFARTYIDWLYGVNLTRYATLKSGPLLRVGRVIVPIVKAIYERDMEIRNFVPEIYYAAVSKEKTKGEEIELVSKQRFDKNSQEEALELCARYNAAGAVVTSTKTKKETIKPGKLFSLSKLQSLLGKKYKMSMAESLSIVQKLYEEGYLTYPRTNSEYLATNEKDKIRQIISNVRKIGYPVKFKDGKTIFDDSKIESHSALTPTYKIPDKSKLSEKEMQVYQTVFRRFVAVFCDEDCIAQKTEIVIDVGNYEQFTLKGITIIQKGFLKFDDSGMKDKVLPPLQKGDPVNIDFKPAEKQTSPPKHYTIETLNNYLKNPFREDKAKSKDQNNTQYTSADENIIESQSKESDDEDYKAIFEGLELGTEATRTGIIDNARKSGYIELKKDVYTILPGGEYLIEQLTQMQISMDKYKTSIMGQALKKIYRGDMTVDEGVRLAEKEIQEIFDTKIAEEDTGFFGDVVGTCPLCGNTVVKGRYGYGCLGYKEGCRFRINSSICKKTISISNARALLENGRTEELHGFISRKGNPFNAVLKLENGEVNFEMKDEDDSEPLGICPVCSNPVVAYRYGYHCKAHSHGCNFRISKNICQTEITEEDVKKLLTDGKTGEIEGFVSKNGKNFKAKLKLEGDKVVFEF